MCIAIIVFFFLPCVIVVAFIVLQVVDLLVERQTLEQMFCQTRLRVMWEPKYAKVSSLVQNLGLSSFLGAKTCISALLVDKPH